MKGERAMWSMGMRCAAIAMLLLSTSCAARVVAPTTHLVTKGKWVVLPFVNESEAPLAGAGAQGIAAALLRIRGVQELVEYQSPSDELFLDESAKVPAAVRWAREQGCTYALLGHVQEWRYRVTGSADPAVSLSLSIVDVNTAKVLWTGTGARSGWGNDTVGGVAHDLLGELLGAIALEPSP